MFIGTVFPASRSIPLSIPGWWAGTVLFYLDEYFQQMMIFLRDRVLNVLVFVIFHVFHCQLRANVASFQLNFLVYFISSEDAFRFASSVHLSESSCQYLVDFHLLVGTLLRDLLVHGSVRALECFISSLGIVQLGYFL